MVDLLVDTKTELLELALRSGLRVFTATLEEDRSQEHSSAKVHRRTDGGIPESPFEQLRLVWPLCAQTQSVAGSCVP